MFSKVKGCLLYFIKRYIFPCNLINRLLISLPCVPSSDRRATLSTKSLLAQLGRNGRTVTAALAAEAKGLTKSVRAILEVDCEYIYSIPISVPAFLPFTF